MKFDAGKTSVLAILTGLVVFGALVLGNAKNSLATFNITYPITICHHNPGNQVTLTFENQQSYFGHLGNPHNWRTYDTFGACTSSTPTPVPSCTPFDDYGIRSSDGSDNHANFNFHNGSKNVDIAADSGYTINEVWLDLHTGSDEWFSFGSGAGNYNPEGEVSIDRAKAHVVKTCPTPQPKTPVCADESYDNFGGEDGEFDPETEVENNGLCQNDETESTPTPAPTPDNDVCDNIDGIQGGVPDGMHLDASGLNCVNWSQAGPPVRNDEAPGQVLGASTGQVLGASTMAGAGGFAEAAYQVIMGVGGILTYLGIKKNKKTSN